MFLSKTPYNNRKRQAYVLKVHAYSRKALWRLSFDELLEALTAAREEYERRSYGPYAEIDSLLLPRLARYMQDIRRVLGARV